MSPTIVGENTLSFPIYKRQGKGNKGAMRQVAYGIVDKCDEYVLGFTWFIDGEGYARRYGKDTPKSGRMLHHEVLRGEMWRMEKIKAAGMRPEVSHLNHNPLDCRRCNVVIGSDVMNKLAAGMNPNRNKRNGAPRGIFRSGNGWIGKIRYRMKAHYTETYPTQQEAVDARRRLHIVLFVTEQRRVSNALADDAS